jgi:hypothetical protein
MTVVPFMQIYHKPPLVLKHQYILLRKYIALYRDKSAMDRDHAILTNLNINQHYDYRTYSLYLKYKDNYINLTNCNYIQYDWERRNVTVIRHFFDQDIEINIQKQLIMDL